MFLQNESAIALVLYGLPVRTDKKVLPSVNAHPEVDQIRQGGFKRSSQRDCCWTSNCLLVESPRDRAGDLSRWLVAGL